MWNRKLKQATKSSKGSSCTRKMEDNCADFISQLPDHLLLHIFWFLDETAVFQSSILSKRWRYLWTLVPFPMAIKEMRSYFKMEKAIIRKEKLKKEEDVGNTISELTVDVAKAVFTTFFSGLPFVRTEIKEFIVIHPLLTLIFMINLYASYSLHHSSLCWNESSMKILQRHDSLLTSSANSHPTTKIPMMKHLFPENYEPRYAKFANLYGLIGMLLMIIISCSITIMKWNFIFKHETDAWIVALSAFCMGIVNLCF